MTGRVISIIVCGVCLGVIAGAVYLLSYKSFLNHVDPIATPVASNKPAGLPVSTSAPVVPNGATVMMPAIEAKLEPKK